MICPTCNEDSGCTLECLNKKEIKLNTYYITVFRQEVHLLVHAHDRPSAIAHIETLYGYDPLMQLSLHKPKTKQLEEYTTTLKTHHAYLYTDNKNKITKKIV